MNTKDMITPRSILVGARRRVATPETWTKGVFAKDADGYPVDTQASQATCFCMLGALWAGASDARSDKTAYQSRATADCFLLDFVRTTTGYNTVSGYNDAGGTTHSGMLAMFDAAIGACPAP